MRFAVLGPVEARGTAGAVVLGGRQRRLLLAVLLSRIGRPVSADVLTDATRPGSSQLVIEIDPVLYDFTARHLPLPSDSGITVTIADAADAITDLPAGGYDLIVNDAYQASAMPEVLTGPHLVRHAARILAPAGMYAVNVSDTSAYPATRSHTATLVGHFAHTCIVAAHAPRQYPTLNAVVAATNDPGGIPAATMAARSTTPLSLIHPPR